MSKDVSFEKRTVIDVESGTEIVIDVDISKLLSTDEVHKRTITYTRKVKPYLDNIVTWRMEGKGAAEVAKILDIGLNTLYEYKRIYPELTAAWDKGTLILGDKIETALYNESLGYEYVEEALTKTGKVVKLTKFARPSVSAIKFALPNIRPSKWTNRVDKPKAGVLSGVDVKALKALTEEELRRFLDTTAKISTVTVNEE